VEVSRTYLHKITAVCSVGFKKKNYVREMKNQSSCTKKQTPKAQHAHNSHSIADSEQQETFIYLWERRLLLTYTHDMTSVTIYPAKHQLHHDEKIYNNKNNKKNEKIKQQ